MDFGVVFCARSELIPTGNTTENCQNNATFVSYDPAKARNELARSNCTYTREFDVIPATGASYWPIIAQCTQFASKTRYLEKFKINISTRRIETKFCTRKRFEYREYFTHIAVQKMTKSSGDIQDLVDMKFRIFGQAVSKYMIVSLCVMF